MSIDIMNSTASDDIVEDIILNRLGQESKPLRGKARYYNILAMELVVGLAKGGSFQSTTPVVT